MKNFKKLIYATLLTASGMMLVPITTNASRLLYFYSAAGTMVNAQDENGHMSSYLTRGVRFDGSNATYAVSNQKDVTALLDSNGTVSQKYNYTAYGVPTTYSAPSLKASSDALSISHNPYSYSNYYTDNESQNYYLNARYYDPVIGTFLTFDTYNLPNRYAYVDGNPVMATDPTGHVREGVLNQESQHTFNEGLDRWHHDDDDWQNQDVKKQKGQDQKGQIQLTKQKQKQEKQYNEDQLNILVNQSSKQSYQEQFSGKESSQASIIIEENYAIIESKTVINRIFPAKIPGYTVNSIELEKATQKKVKELGLKGLMGNLEYYYFVSGSYEDNTNLMFPCCLSFPHAALIYAPKATIEKVGNSQSGKLKLVKTLKVNHYDPTYNAAQNSKLFIWKFPN